MITDDKTGLTRIIKLAKLALKAHLAKLEVIMNKHDKHEMEIGRTIILACHSLLSDRKVLLRKITKLEKENKKLKSSTTKHK